MKPIKIEDIRYTTNAISGIWNSLGCVPKNDEGVILSIETAGSESLASLIGLEAEQANIGVLDTSKKISELVVMLPMIKFGGSYGIPSPSDETDAEEADIQENTACDPCENEVNETSSATGNESSTPNKYKLDNRFYYCPIEKNYLFKIDESVVNELLGVDDYKKYTINQIKYIIQRKKVDLSSKVSNYSATSDDASLILNNSIFILMERMTQYNFPPHLNWLLNKEINFLKDGEKYKKDLPPIVIYTAEFSHILSQDDLSNIWQNTMPGIAINPEMDEVTVEHELSEKEFFGNFNLVEEDHDITLRIFKIKYRGKSSFSTGFEKKYSPFVQQTGQNATGTEPIERSQTDTNTYSPESTTGFNSKWYSYNWPYDYFSLVELLNIQGGEVQVSDTSE